MAHQALVLSISKPSGPTSFDVVHRIRSLLGYKRVGHAGTLDPSATGVLIVLCGAATKWASDYADMEKEYEAVVRFGVETVTDDLTGKVIREQPLEDWHPERIREALREFEGDIWQTPPVVSAVKVGGQRSYKRALRGEANELSARKVFVRRIELLRIEKPNIEIRVFCGKGTYIRSLARDLGRRLGWGATVERLVRCAIGPYRLEYSLSLERVTQLRDEFAGRE
jgi:tRNA pseudouridine55 synthase